MIEPSKDNLKVSTNKNYVRIITIDDTVIQGIFHTKQGGYKARISDAVNDKGSDFITLTDSKFIDIRGKSGKSSLILVNKKNIKLLLMLEIPNQQDDRRQMVSKEKQGRDGFIGIQPDKAGVKKK